MTTPRDVVVVPSALALLPQYAGLEDPVRELRGRALAAVGWLLGRHPDGVRVLAAPQRDDNAARGVRASAGDRVGRALLLATGARDASALDVGSSSAVTGFLVVANGSATRSEKAPGHLDERCFDFDDGIATALTTGRLEELSGLDEELARDLWCHDTPAWKAIGALAQMATGSAAGSATVDYDDDPFGVRYWVVRWTCAS